MIKLEQKALWIDSMGVYHSDPAIVKACTFKDKFHNDFCLAVVKGDKVLVPINMVKTTASDRRVTAPFTTPMVCKAPPRDEDQSRCIKESISLLQQGINHCLKAPTGWGKSYAGVAIACALGEKTLILVTKDDLIDGWMKNLTEVAKIPRGRIGLVKGKVMDWQGKDFVIGTVQSVVRDGKMPQEFFMYFGLLIPDECFHPSTELYTSRGWVGVADITKEDYVAQVHQDTGEVSFAQPLGLVKKPFDDNLINISGSHCDLLATPNHDFFGYKNGVEPTKVTFSDFKPLSRVEVMYAPNPSVGQGITFQERLALAYQADGTIVRHNKRNDDYTVRFAFRKERKVHRLEWILNNCGVEYTKSVNSRGDVCFTYKNKDKPSKSLNWVGFCRSGTWCEEALEEISLWDGWEQEGVVHYESNLENARVVRDIAMLAGRRTSIKPVKKLYRVSCSKGNIRNTKALSKLPVAYKGDVYCVTMPQGTVIAKRNERVTVTGNCHRMGADYFMQAMVLVQARLRLGLSATPKRADGKMFAVRAHIGEVLVEGVNVPMQPKILRVKSGWKIPNVSDITGRKVIYSAGKLAAVYAEMARSPERNKLIVDFVLQAKTAGRTTVVMAEHKEHLVNVYRAMLDAGVNAMDMGMYVGGLKTKAERDIQAHKPIVFATYQFCSEGTDYPHWDTLVYATPRATAEQTAGRVMRKLDGKKMPVVFDLIDDNALLKGYASGRLKDYYKVGAVIVNMWEN